jgi:uncharacterized lipoprotein YehR (DUF1307 family)
MKKRLVTLLAVAMALVLALSLAACGGKGDTKTNSDDAYKIFEKAFKEANDAEQMSMNLDTKISMDIAGTKTDMTMKGPIKTITTAPMQLESTLETQIMGVDMSISMWFKDGYMYTEAMGQKSKSPMDEELALESSNASIASFDKKYLKKTTDKSVTGGTEYTFEIDGAALKELVAGATGSSGVDLNSADITWGDASVKVTIDKDGKMIGQEVIVSLDVEAYGQTIKMDLDMKITDIKTSGVEINYPADLDSYPEGA